MRAITGVTSSDVRSEEFRGCRCLSCVSLLILRAWYGLGQAYELLQQRNQALFYYSKTVFLRPYDARYVIGSAAVP